MRDSKNGYSIRNKCIHKKDKIIVYAYHIRQFLCIGELIKMHLNECLKICQTQLLFPVNGYTRLRRIVSLFLSILIFLSLDPYTHSFRVLARPFCSYILCLILVFRNIYKKYIIPTGIINSKRVHLFIVHKSSFFFVICFSFSLAQSRSFSSCLCMALLPCLHSFNRILCLLWAVQCTP